MKIKNYWQPTPKKWRKIGDAILIGCTSASAFIMGSPFNDNTKAWIAFGLNVLGVFGKVITNLFKEDATDKSAAQ